MKKLFLIAVLLLLGVPNLFAGWVIYTDKALWDTAVAARLGLVSTEDFDNAVIEPWLTITSDGGGTIATFRWNSAVDSSPVKNDTFSFGPEVQATIGWIGNMNLNDPGGPGEGINVVADLGGVDTFIGHMPRTLKGDWGFVIDDSASFTYVRLEGGKDPLGIQETYWMEDMSVGYVVPEPTTLVLVGAGLLLTCLIRRRK